VRNQEARSKGKTTLFVGCERLRFALMFTSSTLLFVSLSPILAFPSIPLASLRIWRTFFPRLYSLPFVSLILGFGACSHIVFFFTFHSVIRFPVVGTLPWSLHEASQFYFVECGSENRSGVVTEFVVGAWDLCVCVCLARMPSK
jgi:hypothetical protein